MSIDGALLVLRLLVGLVLAGHGAQKLFGWFGGVGLKGASGMMEKLGFRPGPLWALIAGLGEFGGGVAVAVGLLTPLAAVALVASMAIAVTRAHWKNGFWSTKGGYEYPLTLLVLGAVVGLTGPGRYSLDALLARAGFNLPDAQVFIAALVLAGIVIVAGLAAGSRAGRPIRA